MSKKKVTVFTARKVRTMDPGRPEVERAMWKAPRVVHKIPSRRHDIHVLRKPLPLVALLVFGNGVRDQYFPASEPQICTELILDERQLSRGSMPLKDVDQIVDDARHVHVRPVWTYGDSPRPGQHLSALLAERKEDSTAERARVNTVLIISLLTDEPTFPGSTGQLYELPRPIR